MNSNQLIHKWIKKIEISKLSNREFFLKNKVPFGIAQYYRYKNKLELGSPMIDGRLKGNNKKITLEIKAFLSGCVAVNSSAALRKLQETVHTQYGVMLSISSVSKYLSNTGHDNTKISSIYSSCAGLEIIIALAHHLGLAESISNAVSNQIEQIKNSDYWKENAPNNTGRNKQGRFTKKYNNIKEIKGTRFFSVDFKRKTKNFRSMSVVSVGKKCIERKALSAIVLPLITENGAIRSVDAPLGNALTTLCGFNYKQSTLTKFFSELKYLGISETLLKQQVVFWQSHWKKCKSKVANNTQILCYYVDGNTKPLWSKHKVKKNKVTMLGRVMGCLEQVFVHDNKGRPLYVETFSANAPNGEYVLELFGKIEKFALENFDQKLKVNRAIVLDGASNSVTTLRAFAAQKKYHFITSLDDNQWKNRKILKEGRAQRYANGKATLKDCTIELTDSKEKGYLIITRAIKIDWDHGKTTVLLTSLDKTVIGASLVVESYFERWPCQELQFRSMKSVASINRVAGYGKQKTDDFKVITRQKNIANEIESLKIELSDIISAIRVEENTIGTLVKQERIIKNRGVLIKGKRKLSKKDSELFLKIGQTISKKERKINAIISMDAKRYMKLKKLERTWLRLQGKETVYMADVELDQIMTAFRISYVNLCNYFLSEFLEGTVMSLKHFVQNIFFLTGTINESKTKKQVVLFVNDKKSDLMKNLDKGLEMLNKLKIKNEDEKILEFSTKTRAII